MCAAALISASVALSQTDTSMRSGTRTWHRVVCHAGTKYCLVTGAHGCEQLAQSRYAAAPSWPGIDLAKCGL